MDTMGILIMYGGIAAVYSWFPASLRPTTWLGWIAFLLVMLFATPVFAVPVSILVCWLWHNFSGSGSSGGLIDPNGFGGFNS